MAITTLQSLHNAEETIKHVCEPLKTTRVCVCASSRIGIFHLDLPPLFWLHICFLTYFLPWWNMYKCHLPCHRLPRFLVLGALSFPSTVPGHEPPAGVKDSVARIARFWDWNVEKRVTIEATFSVSHVIALFVRDVKERASLKVDASYQGFLTVPKILVFFFLILLSLISKPIFEAVEEVSGTHLDINTPTNNPRLYLAEARCSCLISVDPVA